MSISTRYALTPTPEASYFLAPEKPRQRQYEALRAYFVEGLSSAEAAQRFDYTPGSFRVLCYRFRADFGGEDLFFQNVEHGPRTPPVRDRVRERAVVLRKQNLSVYDIQRELREVGQEVSINALSVLLKEEGFARLPRRRDDERPDATRPVQAAVADVRMLDLSPRSFRTRVAGLFFFVPLMEGIDLKKMAQRANLPGSKMIPAEQALRSLLALKLVGVERSSHVMQRVFDEGLSLFAGLNTLPKRSYLAAYSSRVGKKRSRKLMEVWFDEIQKAGIERSGSLDLDFHSVPANPDKEPLDKAYVSKRSRSQKAILVFLARDAEERVLCYSNAAMAKEKRDDEIIRFAEFYRKRTGQYPEELVFDSRLTTHANLDWLREKKIQFLTLRKRSKKMLEEIRSLPSSRWRRVTLRSLTRKYRTPKVLEQRVWLKGYAEEIRQLTVVELGHEEPTILLTNNLKATPVQLITRYARRMLIENGIAEAIHFFHIDALSSMIDLKVDFDLQLTLIGSALYRLLAKRLPDTYRRAQAKTIFRHLLNVSGRVDIGEHDVVVTLDSRAHNPILAETKLIGRPFPMPWLGRKKKKNLILELP